MQKDLTIKKTKSKMTEDFLTKLERSKNDYKEKRVHKAEDVFKELRAKYGY